MFVKQNINAKRNPCDLVTPIDSIVNKLFILTDSVVDLKLYYMFFRVSVPHGFTPLS